MGILEKYDIFPTICKGLRLLGMGNFEMPDSDDAETEFNQFKSLKYKLYSTFTSVLCLLFLALQTYGTLTLDLPHEKLMLGLCLALGHLTFLGKRFSIFFKGNEVLHILIELCITLPKMHNNISLRVLAKSDSNLKCFTLVSFTYLTSVFIFVDEFMQKRNNPDHGMYSPFIMYWPLDHNKAYSWILYGPFLTIGFFIIITSFLMFDMLTISTLVHLRFQFKQVQDCFENIYETAINKIIPQDANNASTLMYKKYSAVFSGKDRRVLNGTVLKEIFKAIELHNNTLRCAEEAQKVFGFGFAMQVVQSLVMLSTLLVRLMEDHSVSCLGSSIWLLSTTLCQLGFHAWNAGNITYEALCVSESITGWPWHECGAEVQRILVPAMVRAQRPLRFKAFGLFELDHGTFIAICRGAYSVFAILYQNQ